MLFHERTLLALGFYIGLKDGHAEEKVKCRRLSTRYVYCKRCFETLKEFPAFFLLRFCRTAYIYSYSPSRKIPQSLRPTRCLHVFIIKPINFFKVILFFIPKFRYEQPSGYRPAPLDLSEVFLSSEQEEVVSLLAENDHNAWARERIRQGWTYDAQQVSSVQDKLSFNDQNSF